MWPCFVSCSVNIVPKFANMSILLLFFFCKIPLLLLNQFKCKMLLRLFFVLKVFKPNASVCVEE